MTTIPINIWDDFYDDGYVPEGEKLETYAYVENSQLTHEIRKESLEALLNYIQKNLNTDGVKLSIVIHEFPQLEDWDKLDNRWEIKIEGLTHKRLDEWMKVLGHLNFRIQNTPVQIYSES